MTHDERVAMAVRHGWQRSGLFGGRIYTTLHRQDRGGRKYAISIHRQTGMVYGAHAQKGQ